MATNILLIVDHPDLANSKANAALLKAVRGIANVKIVDLCATPMEAKAYEENVKNADVLVFQFPFWWGGPPSPMKAWMDALLIGFQESPGMKGKKVLLATTVGSPASAYRAGGYDHYSIDEYLRPYQGAFEYAGMIYLTPFAVYGTLMPDAAVNIEAGAKAYRELIESL